MQIKTPNKKQLDVFVFGLTVILFLFSLKALRHDNRALCLVLLNAVLVLLICYVFKRNFVIQFYLGWMRIVSLIGIVITAIMMLILFYAVFSPIAIILRLLKKDILHLKQDPKKKTYWIERKQVPFEAKNYERQF